MKITKLGISGALLSAIAYFFGFYYIWVAVFIMIFVLIYGFDKDLKINVIQACILFAILLMIQTLYSYIMDFMFFGLGNLEFFQFILKLLEFSRFVVMIYCVRESLCNKVVYIPFVTTFVNNNSSLIEND